MEAEAVKTKSMEAEAEAVKVKSMEAEAEAEALKSTASTASTVLESLLIYFDWRLRFSIFWALFVQVFGLFQLKLF